MSEDNALKEVTGSGVGFLYKTMLERDPGKRRVKPVQKHLIQLDFGLEDSDEDSDFDVNKHKTGSDDDSDAAFDGDDTDEGNERDTVSPVENDDISDDDAEDDTDDEENSETDNSDESEEESEEEKPYYFGMDVDDSDDDDEDYVPKKEREKQQKQKPKNVEKLRIKSPELSQTLPMDSSEVTSKARPMKVLICCVCLGDISETDDEIVECDNCGVAVHEGCYGISDNQSAASTESSASTEPWFCDACKAGVKPTCELCPNEGGIFKETDAGKWVHLVCALYTPGVAFGDVDKLSPVTLFEMSYSKWGAKECSLCEDTRFSKTGVCISCDAGMCRSYFHVTCAQRDGLLSEASPEEVMEVADPFFAYCKLHADKNTSRAKRRHWLAIQSHVRQHAQSEIEDEKEKARFLRKLNRHRQKYQVAKAMRPPSWVPTHKMVRYLTSSPSVMKKMLRKAELMGIITQVQNITHNGEKQDSRKKSHVPPGLSIEFVTYYIDRNVRIDNMKSTLKDLETQHDKLREQEKILRRQYDQLLGEAENLKVSSNHLKKEGEQIYDILNAFRKKKPLQLPEIFGQKRATRSPAKKEMPKSPPAVICQCAICLNTHDQHLLAKCDHCFKFYHLGCLDPPLTRMPKKTSRMGWQCSECVKYSSDESEGSPMDVDAPRRLREKIKEPVKFTPPHTLDIMPSNQQVKKTKKRGRKKKLTPKGAEYQKETIEKKQGARNRRKKTDTTLKVSSYDDDTTSKESTSITTSEKVSSVSGGSSGTKKVKRDEFLKDCASCGEQGNKTRMVKCDECQRCYHFHCLDPPLKKSPKICGYSWHCAACDPARSESDQTELQEEDYEADMAVEDTDDDCYVVE
ncbi:hypothetical protein CHS0354_033363 [Potamilus streckersoni]|uniref:PHD finger protein 14 n=1 Tax=Potamilus streckersoni TaxID=2493646 RepID=A0AAE0VIN6_9BIVA|nr:hypothetical protein CHS0354_033363 [Potamilus streckersoni]